jgi:hypothetical protein
VSKQAQQTQSVPPAVGRHGPGTPADWDLIDSGGPGPFVTWATYQLPDGSRYTWRARDHRKGAGPRTLYADRVGLRTTRSGESITPADPWRRFWAPDRLAWWVALAFIVGTAFFVVGAAGSLMPSVFGGKSRMSIFVETNYFLGATLYTVGIYGQLLEGLNADDRIGPNRETCAPKRFHWFISNWAALARLEILIPFLFLIGSLVFNYETAVSLGSVLELVPRLDVWETSLLGSVLFVLAGLLQYIEAGDRYLTLEVRNIYWWIALLFTVGGIGFVIGCLPGVGAPGFPTAKEGSGPLIVNIGFLIGSISYLIGSYLMLPELFTQLRRQRSARAQP